MKDHFKDLDPDILAEFRRAVNDPSVPGDTLVHPEVAKAYNDLCAEVRTMLDDLDFKYERATAKPWWKFWTRK